MAFTLTLSSAGQVALTLAATPAITLDIWVPHKLGQHTDFDDSVTTAGFVIARTSGGGFEMVAGGGGGGGPDADAIHVNVASEISGILVKANPIGADFLVIEDSAAANVKKHILISSLPGAATTWTGLTDTPGSITAELLVVGATLAGDLVQTDTPRINNILDTVGATILGLSGVATAANHIDIRNNVASSNPIIRAQGTADRGIDFLTSASQGVFRFRDSASETWLTIESTGVTTPNSITLRAVTAGQSPQIRATGDADIGLLFYNTNNEINLGLSTGATVAPNYIDIRTAIAANPAIIRARGTADRGLLFVSSSDDSLLELNSADPNATNYLRILNATDGTPPVLRSIVTGATADEGLLFRDSNDNEILGLAVSPNAVTFLQIANSQGTNRPVMRSLSSTGAVDLGLLFADTNNNEILGLNAIAGATSYVNIRNSEPGPPPIISVVSSVGGANLGFRFNDTNGNELLELSVGNAAATNFLRIINSTASDAVELRVLGAANAGITLTSDGTGDILLNASAGGSIRWKAGALTTVQLPLDVPINGEVLTITDAAANPVTTEWGPPGAEINDLNAVATSAADNFVFIGTGVDAGAYIVLPTSGEVLSFDGATFSQAAVADLSDVASKTGSGTQIVFAGQPTLAGVTWSSDEIRGGDHTLNLTGGLDRFHFLINSNVGSVAHFDVDGELRMGGSGDNAFRFILTGVPSASNKTWTFQNESDTVVGRNTTDVLTNKSISGPQIDSGTLPIARIGTGTVTHDKIADFLANTYFVRTAGAGAPGDTVLGGFPTEANPASGDWAIGFDNTGIIKKFDLVAFLSAGGGTLDDAYDLGATITADGGPVTISAAAQAGDDLFKVETLPTDMVAWSGPGPAEFITLRNKTTGGGIETDDFDNVLIRRQVTINDSGGNLSQIGALLKLEILESPTLGTLTVTGLRAIEVNASIAEALVLDCHVAGGSNPNFSIGADGAMDWGPGGGGITDTNLARTGSTVLKVSNILDVVTGFRIGGAAPNGSLLRGESGEYIALPLGTATHVLTSVGGQAIWQAPAGGSAHNLLDPATHTDTVLQTVSQGSIILGNAGLFWDELTIGGNGTYLHSNGTIASWSGLDMVDADAGTLPVVRGGTGLATIAINSLIYASAADVFSARAPGTDTHVLTMVSGVPQWQAPSGGTTHDLLSSTHPDTVTAPPLRGSLVIGTTATPVWSRVVKGATGTYLRADADDALWSALTLTDASQVSGFTGTTPSSIVMSNSPTITDPNIGSFVNANHDHSAAGASGGVIVWASINKATSSIEDITTRAITNLSDVATKTGSGTQIVFAGQPTLAGVTWSSDEIRGADHTLNLTGGIDRFNFLINSSVGQVAHFDVDGTLRFGGSGDNAFRFILTGPIATSDKTWTFINETGTVVGLDNTQTITGKTITAAANTLTIALADLTDVTGTEGAGSTVLFSTTPTIDTPTLTTPRIVTGGSINNSVGDEYLEFTQVGTPFNHVRIEMGASGIGALLTVDGADASADLRLLAKGGGGRVVIGGMEININDWGSANHTHNASATGGTLSLVQQTASLGTAGQKLQVNTGASAPEWADDVKETGITVDAPVEGDIYPFYITRSEITVLEIIGICDDGTSVSVEIRQSTSVIASAPLVDTAVVVTTAVTSFGVVLTPIVPIDRVVMIDIGAVVGNPVSVHITMYYTINV